jgi:glycosyltransferase involved in cell wall biosynthesis
VNPISVLERDRTRYRIAILAETFPPAGGGVPAAHYGLYELLKVNHTVKLFAFADGRLSDDVVIRSDGLAVAKRGAAMLAAAYVRRFDRAGGSFESQRIAATIPAILELNRKLAKFQPDFIFVPDFAAPGLALKRPSGAKLIWMAHHNYRRFENIPVLPNPGWYDTYLAHRLERRALRKFDYAIFPSRYMEQVFRETLDATMPGCVIPHAIPERTPSSQSRAATRQKLRLPEDSVLVYIPSGGTPAKGERYVFEITRRLLAAYHPVYFFVSGPIDSRLRAELLNSIPPDRLILPGTISLSDNLDFTDAADVAVSPTLVENFSCALLEAQAFGVPCVTFDTGGNKELVRDGETGYVVPYLDLETLIARSIELIVDPILRGRMSANARKHAAEQSDAQNLRMRYEDVMNACDSVPSGTA